MPVIPASARLTGAARDDFRERVAPCYQRGANIRQISVKTGRSYGSIHRLLREAGADLRDRGGSHIPPSPSVSDC
ncbi:helix-turn-helix domain-containing protein [Streptomyces sp. ADI92-24]|uniref:helix-turn-helix domain-containing protein n=1 Tax=Streptomyces sp. ADI92-24 TaxID=1522756 RepID=UPI000F55498A|nr:helix-turn-helix domain-containing protein [Streptomyces sp. ADI92-24]